MRTKYLQVIDTIFDNNIAKQGGGVFWLFAIEKVIMLRSTFTNNKAGQKGGVISQGFNPYLEV